MSMMMFRSTQPGHDQSNGQSGFFTMIYSVVAITVIERIMAFLPVLLSYVQEYMDRRWKDSQQTILDSVSALSRGGGGGADDPSSAEPKHKEIAASIRFFAKSNNADNIVCAAVKKVLFTNKTYLINNTDAVLLDNNDEIYAQLHKVFSLEDTDDSPQILDVYSYHLDIHGLRQFIEKVTANYTRKIQNKLGDNLFFFNCIPARIPSLNGVKDYSRAPPLLPFTMKRFQTNRRFRNVLGEQSRLIQKRVEFFKNNKKWYDDKGIPYTLGLLLCGPPGGGKTSTIKCIANEMQRHIINITFSSDITRTQLETLFYSDVIHVNANGRTETFSIPIDKRIYVIEDVDCDQNDIVMDRASLACSSSNCDPITVSAPTPVPATNPTPAASANSFFPFVPNTPASTSDVAPANGFRNRDNLHYVNVDKGITNWPNGNDSTFPFATDTNITSSASTDTRTYPVVLTPNGPYQRFRGDNNGASPPEEDSTNKLTLSCLLNLLDGVLETPGRILIMTSNYPGTLDKALIRPGRIDLITEFQRCNHQTLQEFIETFYDVKLTADERQKLENETTEYMYTPAELSKILFECFESHTMAIERLCKQNPFAKDKERA
jgi:DNA polymerase III delta prime subunit